jgi:hypothetical protein
VGSGFRKRDFDFDRIPAMGLCLLTAEKIAYKDTPLA